MFKKKTYRLLTVLAGTLASFLGLVLSLFRQGRWLFQALRATALKAAARMGSHLLASRTQHSGTVLEAGWLLDAGPASHKLCGSV